MCERYKLCAKCGNRVSDDTVTCIICGGENFIEDENLLGAGFARAFSECETESQDAAAQSASAKLQRLEKTLDRSLLKSKGYAGAPYQAAGSESDAGTDALKVSDVEKMIVRMEARLSEKIADMEDKFMTKTVASEDRSETKLKKKHRGESKNVSRSDKNLKGNYAAYSEIENRLSDMENALASRIRDIENKLPAAAREETPGDRMKEIADRLAGLESKLDDKILGAEENIRRSVERSREGFADGQGYDRSQNAELTEKLDSVAKELQKRITEIENQITDRVKDAKNPPFDSNIAYLDGMLRNLEKSIDSKIAGVEDKIKRSETGQSVGMREPETQTSLQIANLLKQLEEKLSGKITEIETKLSQRGTTDCAQIHTFEGETPKSGHQQILDDIMRFQNNRILQVENELRENMKTLNELKEAGYAESDQKRRRDLAETERQSQTARQDENLREQAEKMRAGENTSEERTYPVYPPQSLPFAMPNASGDSPAYGVPVYGAEKADRQAKEPASGGQADSVSASQGDKDAYAQQNPSSENVRTNMRAHAEKFADDDARGSETDGVKAQNLQGERGESLSSGAVYAFKTNEESGHSVPAEERTGTAEADRKDELASPHFSESQDVAAGSDPITVRVRQASAGGSFNIDSDVVMSDSIKDILEYNQSGKEKKRGNTKKVSDRKASRIFHRGTKRFETAAAAAQEEENVFFEMREGTDAQENVRMTANVRACKTHVFNLCIGIVAILSALLILLPFYGSQAFTAKGYDVLTAPFHAYSVYHLLMPNGSLWVLAGVIPYILLCEIALSLAGGIMMITRSRKKVVLVLETLCLGLGLLSSVCLLLANNLVFFTEGFPQIGVLLQTSLSALIFVTACIFLFVDLPKRQSKAVRAMIRTYKADGRNAKSLDKTKRSEEKQQPDKNVKPFTLDE